jgi:hypothetical protein
VTLIGALAALLSALALFAGSGHCRWRLPVPLRRHGSAAGALLAIASLVAWIAALGVGTGLCAMLGCWMMAMMALPCLAALTETSPR